ncbi:MAG TPA: potassium transporter, partial [Thiotrichales bacterium]|nr:potassium transporter [Thiotrichales bacterium]
MVPPLLVSLWYGDGEAADFALTLAAMLGAGGVLFLATRRGSRELRRRDGFLIVAGFWLLTSLLGAIPFMFGLHLSFVNALFESASGLTTTGATVVQGLDGLAPSILFYRQELQWFGGMGLIVLAVAVLPMLGIGGMSVYRAETPGPMKDEKLTPQLAHTARTLWFIYIGFTLACALGYWLAGMSEFDAVAHALSTVSTGGFSTHDASLGYYHSDWIEIIAILFMLAGGINFSVHFLALRGLSLRAYIADAEVRAFLAFVGLVTLTVAAVLTWTGEYPNIHQALMNASFETVSIVTSTGFGVADFSTWPLFLPVLMIFISFVGGCGGS